MAAADESAPLLIALNKCDVTPPELLATLKRTVFTAFGVEERQTVAVSARTGEGIETLEAALVAPYLLPEPDAIESVTITAARHAQGAR